ncbi:MAG: 16S rRNA (uracil(1498)-N(3))-methyltransferase [Clostridia bacterium]|nr:16S rRNA (uracil(1498)-N(3))-methyltransferase [Clostridia bacterium]
MFNFFSETASFNGGFYRLTGKNFNHVKNVLRLKTGEQILVSFGGKSDLCEITEFTQDEVLVKIIQENAIDSCLPIKITLFQGLPKSDKLEIIIQKAVELGADAVVPVEMKNCVVKIEDKKKQSKRERWQNIAESASKQSKRSFVPEIYTPTSFSECVNMAKNFDLVIVPYENQEGMQSTEKALSLIKKGMNVGVFIGPEGGFDKTETDALLNANAITVSLGKRILRTETASITALSMLMLYAEMKVK